MPEPFRMAQLSVDAAALSKFGARRLGEAATDLGYVAHLVLEESFGRGALRPFRLLEPPDGRRRKRLSLLGYTALDSVGLREQVELARPDVAGIVDPASIAVKEMPTTWRAERALAFELLTTPTVRLSSQRRLAARSGSGREPLDLEKGAEVDAWLHANFLCDGSPADESQERRSRSEVYLEWLAGALAPAATFLPGGVRIASFRRERFARRDAARRVTPVERPRVLFDGRMTIADAEAFDALLRRGVGRQRAFGLGMLLLRPG